MLTVEESNRRTELLRANVAARARGDAAEARRLWAAVEEVEAHARLREEVARPSPAPVEA